MLFLKRLVVRKESDDTWLMFDPVMGAVFIADSEMHRIVSNVKQDTVS